MGRNSMYSAFLSYQVLWSYELWFSVQRSAFSVQRSAFSVQRLEVGVVPSFLKVIKIYEFVDSILGTTGNDHNQDDDGRQPVLP